MFMEQEYTSLPYIISNIIAVFAAIAAMLWPTVARVLLSAIFIAASFFNAYTAFADPNLYLAFGELASNDFYRSIILGPFSRHIQLYILLIAVCQLLIGVFGSYKGRLMKIAMIGGVVFLLAIVPLGTGSAFPAPLMLALAYMTLLRKRIDFNIYEVLRQKVDYSN
jgi:hypothetical protein